MEENSNGSSTGKLLKVQLAEALRSAPPKNNGGSEW